MKRIDVEVIARHRVDGSIEPLTVFWTDGRVFEITKILDKRIAAGIGGTGYRYKIQVGQSISYLFYDKDHYKWFVEMK